jgi:hypothetical protein
MVIVMALAGGAAAQQPPPQQRPAQPDTMRPRLWQPRFQPEMQDRDRVMRFQQQIEERFGRMVQTELDLNDPLMDRLRTAMRANQDRHRDLNRREQDLHRAIGNQLQPGVAANQDSLNRLLEAALQARLGHVQSDQQFNRELAQFLSPVQRARLMMMMRRFEDRVDEIRGRVGRRIGPQPGLPPAMQPGQRPMRRPQPGPEDLP